MVLSRGGTYSFHFLDIPYFDSSIEGASCEKIRVIRVELAIKDRLNMALQRRTGIYKHINICLYNVGQSSVSHFPSSYIVLPSKDCGYKQGRTGIFFWGGVMALKGSVENGQALNGCSHLENFYIIMGPGWRSPLSHPGQTAPGYKQRRLAGPAIASP